MIADRQQHPPGEGPQHVPEQPISIGIAVFGKISSDQDEGRIVFGYCHNDALQPLNIAARSLGEPQVRIGDLRDQHGTFWNLKWKASIAPR